MWQPSGNHDSSSVSPSASPSASPSTFAPYLVYLFHLISIDLESSCSVNSTHCKGLHFGPYYLMTHHLCFQLQLYISSAAMVHLSAVMVHRRHQPFCHPFHVYIEALVPYRINRVLILLVRFNSFRAQCFRAQSFRARKSTPFLKI